MRPMICPFQIMETLRPQVSITVTESKQLAILVDIRFHAFEYPNCGRQGPFCGSMGPIDGSWEPTGGSVERFVSIRDESESKGDRKSDSKSDSKSESKGERERSRER